MLRDAAEILCAGELIRLGARLPLLESVTALSRRKLTRLYKQVAGTPPSTGQLPYSADWFINWQHNLHATAFYHVWVGVQPQKKASAAACLLSAYRLYLENCPPGCVSPLTLTRAWMLIRFCQAGMLELIPCSHCGGKFINHRHQPQGSFICCFCQPPSRAQHRCQPLEQA
ncbi:FlhC family transcriptional regulator [Tatumella saanichensis]|uniref:FlhC family transcriptional regulator n=1 Tax=Tatumella saanichensis TaxID=480813 RepID=UPI0004AE815C|nr:FlhC family transcriptional regulator [Tatumella saanichensis]